MYSPFLLAAKYIRYYITAANGKGHGIHSPFVFDFVTRVLNDKRDFYPFGLIEERRRLLLTDQRLLEIADFGAGSVAGNAVKRTVASIARNAAKSRKLGQLLFRIVNYYRPQNIIELGTSLGISGAYLAMANNEAQLLTLEGAPAIAAAAKENFAQLQIPNSTIITGNFDDTLATALEKLGRVDLAFVDGNHRPDPTWQYFEELMQRAGRPAILIFDDIHWSAGMEAAWEKIKSHPDVLLTIDLFFLGLVFLSPEFKVKQHFVIRF